MTTTTMTDSHVLNWYPAERTLYHAMVDYMTACREAMTYGNYMLVRLADCPAINICGNYTSEDVERRDMCAGYVWDTARHYTHVG